MSKMMRITEPTAQNLEKLAKISGTSKQAILEQAVEAFLRELFLNKANEEYALIKANSDLWASEAQEREEWDVTLNDGLGDHW